MVSRSRVSSQNAYVSGVCPVVWPRGAATDAAWTLRPSDGPALSSSALHRPIPGGVRHAVPCPVPHPRSPGCPAPCARGRGRARGRRLAPCGGRAMSATASEHAAARTPLRAVRVYCLWCCSDSYNEVRECPSQSCALWPYRHGHNPKLAKTGPTATYTVGPKMTARRALMLKCADCYSMRHTDCGAPDCPLHGMRQDTIRRRTAARRRPLHDTPCAGQGQSRERLVQRETPTQRGCEG